ncbi:ANL_HP_G0029420.mRNA.1.CDS.1 [Saccharomyces cerevisiae]|nr:ANL_HP_G0029420.mRNA.1.CDS.1 [Saccharomyces cerevisiae]CAI6711339.1 ANL_HP_G0029420.mRNA.1.CDS.1 [Saccharomyces cerevisiae]
MGYVIKTLSSARISERRAKIIYIYMHLSAYKINFPFVQFPTFFSLFRRTLQLEQYIKSIKQSLSFYCVFLTTLHISPQFPAYNFVFSSSFQLLLLDIIL